MFIKGVELKNIRSYKHEKIEFSEGSTLLSGNIGSGKSTILQAIEFAIFGNQKGVIHATSLLRHGESQGSITVNITIDNKNIIIYRVLKKGNTGVTQSSGYVEVDGVRHEGVVTEMRSKIYSLLDYDENTKARSLIYRYTVYTPQEEMKAIVLESPEVRMDIIRKVFNIDKYKTVKENAQLYMRELRIRQRVLEKTIEGYTDLLEKRTQIKFQQTTIRKDIKKQEKLLTDVKKKLFQEEKNLKSLRKDAENVQKQENKVQILETKIKTMKEKKQILEVQKKDHQYQIHQIDQHVGLLTSKKNRFMITYEALCKDFDFEQTENMSAILEILSTLRQEQNIEGEREEEHLKNLQEELSLLGSQLASSQKEQSLKSERKEKLMQEQNIASERLNTLSKKLELSKAKVKDVSSELDIDKLKKTLSELRIQHDEFLTKRAQFATKKKSYVEEIASLEDINSCPLCKQDVPHKHKKKIASEYEERIKKIDAILEKIQKNIDIVQKRDVQIREQVDQLQQIQVVLAQVKQEEELFTELNERYDRQTKELVDLTTEEENLVKKIHMIKERVVKLTEAIAKREKNIISRRQMQKRIQGSLDDATEIKAHTDNMRKDEERKQNSIKKILAINVELEQIDKMLEEGAIELETMRKELVKDSMKDKLTLAEEGVQKIISEIQDIQLEIARLGSDDKHITEQLADKSEEIKVMDLERKKLQKTKSFHTWLETYLVPLVQAIERRVLSFYKMEFERTFSDTFSHIVEDENMKVFVDEGFSPCVVQNGYDVPVVDLSGGEKTSVSLAYRLALFKVINSFVDNAKTRDVLILDEPTDGFSDMQLDRLRDIFWDLAVKQLIIVSHETKLESFAQNFIHIVKTEHVSRIV